MKLAARSRQIERRKLFSGDWKPRDADEAENRLFDRSFNLSEVARELEIVAGANDSTAATASSLGCASSAFESIAVAVLKMRGAVISDGESSDHDPADAQRKELGLLLDGISENLMHAAKAADGGRELATEIEWRRAPTD